MKLSRSVALVVLAGSALGGNAFVAGPMGLRTCSSGAARAQGNMRMSG